MAPASPIRACRPFGRTRIDTTTPAFAPHFGPFAI